MIAFTITLDYSKLGETYRVTLSGGAKPPVPLYKGKLWSLALLTIRLTEQVLVHVGHGTVTRDASGGIWNGKRPE